MPNSEYQEIFARESAKGVVSNLNALLEKGVIWKFQGAQPEENTRELTTF